MSIKAMSYVWQSSRTEGAHLLVLLAIADHANDDGEAWPSTTSLSQKTRTAPRSVQRHLRDLVAMGELDIIENGGRYKTAGGFQKTNMYIIKGVTAVSPPLPIKGGDIRIGPISLVQTDVSTPKTTQGGDTKGVTTVTPRTVSKSIDKNEEALERGGTSPVALPKNWKYDFKREWQDSTGGAMLQGKDFWVALEGLCVRNGIVSVMGSFQRYVTGPHYSPRYFVEHYGDYAEAKKHVQTTTKEDIYA